MSYFSSGKSDRAVKAVETVPEAKPAVARAVEREIVSTLGAGLLVTGNIVSTGAVQVFGRVQGDIHSAHLVLGKGASVEGNVRAQDVVIEGTFKGTVHGNTVKLQATAAVEGEIYNRSLAIDQNAHFEGIARRLNQPVEAPTEDQLVAQTPALAPEQPMNNGYVNGNAFNGQYPSN